MVPLLTVHFLPETNVIALNPEVRSDAMTDGTPALTRLHSETTHAVEVRDAQSAADEVGKCGRPVSPPGEDTNADLEVIRSLVAVYGTNGVRRMIDSVVVTPTGLKDFRIADGT
jgi:hypothetical protein